MPQPIWNSLEVTKIIVNILTPVSVVIFGWLLNRRLKEIDYAQWSNQKIVEKRLSLFDEISPMLNKLFCFYVWVGYWKEISPEEVIFEKRELDKKINIYRHVLGEKFYSEYQTFMRLLFETYTGPGHDAKIKSKIKSSRGDRSIDYKEKWDKSWNSSFVDSSEATDIYAIEKQYFVLMDVFRDSIGIRETHSEENSEHPDH